MAAECIARCAEAATSRTGVRPPPTTAAVARRRVLKGVVARLATSVRRRRRIARTVRLLRSLDERTLRDIGVPPERVHEFATKLTDRCDRR